MPIYEYRRKDGTTFEVIQKFSDDPLATDPDTGQPVQRVYSAPAIHFKGSGFHNTDYGSSRRPRSGAESGADSGSSATSSEPSNSSSESSSSASSSDSSSGGSSGDKKNSDKGKDKAKKDSKASSTAA